jgi:hypothetical protein
LGIGKAIVEKPDLNLVNAGILFMFSVWLQSQMVDLIIFRKNPNLIGDFVANPDRVPREFHQLRAKYWEKNFSQIKTEFLSAYASKLNGKEVDDIEHVYHLRNMIGHAHVSIARNYMLFRPGGEKRERAVVDAFKPKPVSDRSDPLMFKLEFWKPDKFKAFSDLMERVDQQCFGRIAADLGVPHGRIR